jgi:hypothetical protein
MHPYLCFKLSFTETAKRLRVKINDRPENREQKWNPENEFLQALKIIASYGSVNGIHPF